MSLTTIQRLLCRRMAALCLLTAPWAAGAAAPSIHIGAMYEYMEPQQGTILKRVRNSGDATAFVRVQISEVVYNADGSHVEREVDTRSVAAGQAVDGLISSPARLIVAANGQQATRLLYQGNREVERYYRVRFVPVLPQTADEFALDAAEAAAYQQQLSAGVNVLTGYGAFLIVHPQQVRHQTLVEQRGKQLHVRNAGNSSVVIDDLRECAGERNSDCSPSRKQHLLPQREQVFELREGHQLAFELIEGEQRRRFAFAP